MFRIWCEVWSADDTTWYGIVDLQSVAYNQRLDQAGTLSINLPATDPVAVKYMQIGRRIRVYWNRHGKREIARGVLLQKQVGITGGNLTTTWQATDIMEDLRQKSTLRGLIYDNISIETVVKDLVARVSGWAGVTTGVIGTTTQRFDGVSILRALNTIALSHGYHFRLDGEMGIEFGVFGDDSGVRFAQALEYYGEMPWYIALVDQLDLITVGHEIVNWIEPISGPVDGGLTLRRSTRTTPYSIRQTTGPNGQPVYYLADDASIAAYGQRERVWSPDLLIAPVTATTTSLINAADVLYDAAATFLQRNKDPQLTYRTSVRNLKVPVKVGQKIRLFYKGEVYQDGEIVDYVDINDDFWVMGINERWGINGYVVSYEISRIDNWPPDAADMLAGVIQGSSEALYQRQINVDRTEFTSEDTISRASSVSITFNVQNTTIEIPTCLVTVTRTWVADGPHVFTLFLDGEEIEGGPWLVNASASPDSFEVNIADQIMDSATIQGEHTLELECLYGSGTVDTLIVLVETLLPGIAVPANPFGSGDS